MSIVRWLMGWLGVWIPPGGEDAYCMRVGRAVDDGVGKLAGSYETFERYARRQRGRVERLDPPAELEDEHERLIELLGEADEAVSDSSRSLKVRATQAARSLRYAREHRTAIVDRSDNAHARYTKAIADVEESSESLIEGAFERAEQAVEAMVEKVEGANPPEALSGDHDALVKSSRSYLEALRAYHDAVRELDPERVGKSVNDCELARAAVKDKLRDVCGERKPES